jgi:phage terminase large subunit-like protein
LPGQKSPRRRKTTSKKTPSRRSRQKQQVPEQLSTRDYVAIALKYARDIVSGAIPSCKWVKAACQRHLDDLEKSKSPEYPWKFVPDSATAVCEFIEHLPHTKDDFEYRAATGQRLQLTNWQIFVTCVGFGWLAKNSKVKTYRFREIYVEVPRKNGKSTWAAGIGIFKFAADGEHGAEVYSGATSEKQAWEVFRPAKLMTQQTPDLREFYGIEVNAKSLTIPANGSRFEPVIGKPGDGASPSCAIIDEFHEHPGDDLVSTMRTGMGARRNPLLFIITTAGNNRTSPCYQRHLDVKQLLKGALKDDRLFGIIYSIDDEDDWRDPAVLEKANPNFGISIQPDTIRRDLENAIQSARLQNDFKIKHENIWENAAAAWMNMAAWDKCKDPNLRLEDFLKERGWAGLDLANRIDLADKVLLFKRLINGKEHLYAFATHYLNEAAIENAQNASHYKQWAAQGLLVVTPGSMTDHKWIADDLIADCKKFHLLEVDHDPYGSDSLVGFLQANPEWDQHCEFVKIDQNVKNLSPAMKYLEGMVLDGRFHHTGDEILTWGMSNVTVKPDRNDNIFPRKERDENKIDPASALFNTIVRASIPGEGPSIYETRGLVTL